MVILNSKVINSKHNIRKITDKQLAANNKIVELRSKVIETWVWMKTKNNSKKDKKNQFGFVDKIIIGTLIRIKIMIMRN